MRMMTARHRAAGLLAAIALGLAGLTACSSSEGVETNCSLESCTLTFDRSMSATANILGVEVKLVNAEASQVTLEVGGQQVTVPVNGATQVGQLSVAVQSVTSEEVVVQVTRGQES